MAEVKIASTSIESPPARALIAALEQEARELGATRLVLETGVRQPEANGLYRSEGFSEIPLFGEYVGSALSVCMAKDLASGSPSTTGAPSGV